MLNFFAAAPKGYEYALSLELAELGASEIKESVAGVYFSASLEVCPIFAQAPTFTSWKMLALSQPGCSSASFWLGLESPLDSV